MTTDLAAASADGDVDPSADVDADPVDARGLMKELLMLMMTRMTLMMQLLLVMLMMLRSDAPHADVVQVRCC